MRKFEKGDRIELIGNNSMNARVGQRASVVGCGEKYVCVTWDPLGVDEQLRPIQQMNGDYDIEHFRKVNTDWDD